MFVAMGLSAIVPVLHGINSYGVERLGDLIGLRWLVLQGFLYVLGATIYAVSRIASNRISVFIKSPLDESSGTLHARNF